MDPPDTINQYDYLTSLPDELLIMIITWLPVEEIVSICVTCHRLAFICDDERLWKCLAMKDYNVEDKPENKPLGTPPAGINFVKAAKVPGARPIPLVVPAGTIFKREDRLFVAVPDQSIATATIQPESTPLEITWKSFYSWKHLAMYSRLTPNALLIKAAYRGNLSKLRVAIEHGANYLNYAFIMAEGSRNTEATKILSDKINQHRPTNPKSIVSLSVRVNTLTQQNIAHGNTPPSYLDVSNLKYNGAGARKMLVNKLPRDRILSTVYPLASNSVEKLCMALNMMDIPIEKKIIVVKQFDPKFCPFPRVVTRTIPYPNATTTI